MKNEPAYPIVEPDSYNSISSGLSKREYFAGLAAPVMLSNLYKMAEKEHKPIENLFKVSAWASVEFADALLEALNESK